MDIKKSGQDAKDMVKTIIDHPGRWDVVLVEKPKSRGGHGGFWRFDLCYLLAVANNNPEAWHGLQKAIKWVNKHIKTFTTKRALALSLGDEPNKEKDRLDIPKAEIVVLKPRTLGECLSCDCKDCYHHIVIGCNSGGKLKPSAKVWDTLRFTLESL